MLNNSFPFDNAYYVDLKFCFGVTKVMLIYSFFQLVLHVEQENFTNI